MVRLPNLFGKRHLQKIRASINQYYNLAPLIHPSLIVREADGLTIRNFLRMDLIHQFFLNLAEDANLKTLVSSIVGWEPEVFFVDSFNKQGKVGSAVQLHQDAAYIKLSKPEWTTIWIAIDLAEEENGALLYYLGSHRLGVLPHRPTGEREGLLTVADPAQVFSGSHGVYVAELPPGGMVLHDSRIAHESRANLSENSRFGLTIGYRGAASELVY